jgi:hypothetical protein
MLTITHTATMKTKSKITTLEEVFKYLAWIPRINNGGCGISALAIYRWLEKENLLIKNPILKYKNTRFVFCYEKYCKSIMQNNKKAVKNLDTPPIAPNHAVLYHMGEYIDADGIVDISTYEWMQNITEEEFIVRANNNVDYWNPDFNRNKYLGLIEKKLDIDLSDIRLRELYPWEIIPSRTMRKKS